LEPLFNLLQLIDLLEQSLAISEQNTLKLLVFLQNHQCTVSLTFFLLNLCFHLLDSLFSFVCHGLRFVHLLLLKKALLEGVVHYLVGKLFHTGN